MENFKEAAKKIEERIVKWRRDLHQIPEIGNNLPQTSKYVQNALTEMGIPFKTLVDGNAIVALIEGGKPGKTVALRADMDALPVVEETPEDFKSTNGNMHACGHDSHTAMLLGAAEILNGMKSELKGNVKLLFQPGEESPGGAQPMIKEGALENPKVDAIFGQHIGCLFSDVPTGKVIISRGAAMACRDNFKITVKGVGAHSSTPHVSVDPIMIAAQIINGVYMIKAREIDALSPAVLSICMVHGGTAGNIIPETVTMEGSTRSVDEKVQKLIDKRIGEVVKSTCEAYGAQYTYEFFYDYPVTENNPEMADFATECIEKVIGKENIIPQMQFLMGSEDMSFFLNEVPGAYFFLTSTAPQDGVVYAHHNPKFKLDEAAFVPGTACLCQIAVDYLNK